MRAPTSITPEGWGVGGLLLHLHPVSIFMEKLMNTKALSLLYQTKTMKKKKRKPPIHTQVKTITIIHNMQKTAWWHRCIHLMCFVLLSVWHLLYRLHWICHSESLSPWLMNFESKRSMNLLRWVHILQHKQRVYLTVYTGSQWVDLSQGNVARKIWLFALHSNAALSLVLFMPVEFHIGDWNLPLSSVPWLSYSSRSPVVSLK